MNSFRKIEQIEKQLPRSMTCGLFPLGWLKIEIQQVGFGPCDTQISVGWYKVGTRFLWRDMGPPINVQKSMGFPGVISP